MSDWLVSNTGQGKRRIEPAAEPDSTHITTIGESTEVVTEPQHGLDDDHNAMQAPEAGAMVETATVVEEHPVTDNSMVDVMGSAATCGSLPGEESNEALHQALGVAVAMVVCVSQEGASSTMYSNESLEMKTSGVVGGNDSGAIAAAAEVNVPQYACESCGQRFLRKSHLSRHNLIHSGERPFHCTICDKYFRQSSHLASHKNTHTGARPYVCEQCSKAFASSSALGRHRHTHTDPSTKPHVCECGKAFRRLSHLVGHRYTHTGERPYSCKECGRAFADSSGLRRHKRRHATGTVGPDGLRRSSLGAGSRNRRRRPGDELEDGELQPLENAVLIEMEEEEAEMEESAAAVTVVTDNLRADDQAMDEDGHKEDQSDDVFQATTAVGSSDTLSAALGLGRPSPVSLATEISSAGMLNSNALSVASNTTALPQSTISITETLLSIGSSSSLSLSSASAASGTESVSATGMSVARADVDSSGVSVGESDIIDVDGVTGLVHDGTLDFGGATVLASGGGDSSLDATATDLAALDPIQDDLCCASCNEIFTTMSDLTRHARTVHSDKEDKPFRCLKCSKCFSRLGHLRRHHKTHLPPDVHPFSCNLCGRQFRIFSYLNAHRYSHLENSTTHTCELCSKIFMDTASLQRHSEKHAREAGTAAAAAAMKAAVVEAASMAETPSLLTAGLTGEEAEALSAAVVAVSSSMNIPPVSVNLGHDVVVSLEQSSPSVSLPPGLISSGVASNHETVQLLSTLINPVPMREGEDVVGGRHIDRVPTLLPIVQPSAMSFVPGDGHTINLSAAGEHEVMIPASVTVELASDHHHHHHQLQHLVHDHIGVSSDGGGDGISQPILLTTAAEQEVSTADSECEEIIITSLHGES